MFVSLELESLVAIECHDAHCTGKETEAALPCRLAAFYLVFFLLLVFGTSPLGREEGAGLAGLPPLPLSSGGLSWIFSLPQGE